MIDTRDSTLFLTQAVPMFDMMSIRGEPVLLTASKKG
jgi:hypothetical protein